MGITKENDGRGARKAFFRRLTTIFLLLAVIIFGIFLINVTQGDEDDSRVRRERPTRGQQRGGGGLMSMLTGGRSRMNSRLVVLDVDDLQSLEPLLSGAMNLIDVQVEYSAMAESPENTYTGVTGEFCQLDFELHKRDPSAVPMFRHLVEESYGCKRGKHYKIDLKAFANLARKHDLDVKAKGESVPKVLDLAGVVFHESRCGSTLVANALVAMNPSEHRVYSESAPPIAALKTTCGDLYQFCSVSQAAQILADVVYLMSRTNNAAEKRVFFKIQSIGTKNIEVFQHAFPHTPWIFVYRDPVQVMASQLKMGASAANCVRQRVRSNEVLTQVVERKGLKVREISDEMYCAAHLATITESAVEAMQREPRLGTPVNYKNLPQILYTDILPNKFGVAVTDTEIDNIIRISGVYSKGTSGRHGDFKEDSEAKEHSASPSARKAAEVFLTESYEILENGGIKHKPLNA